MPARSRRRPDAPADHPSLTLALGEVSRDAERRELPAGSTVLSFDLSVRADGRATESVPVAWPDPPGRVTLSEGDEVLVLGRTRRRFFRSGGATTSRTEIVAERVVLLRQRARCATALADAARRLAAIGAPLTR